MKRRSSRAENLRRSLPDASSALLEYVVGDDKTYSVCCDERNEEADVRVYTLPMKRDDLAKQTEAFRQQLAARDLGFRASAVKLYELLLKPAEAQLRGKPISSLRRITLCGICRFKRLLNSANRFLIEDAAISLCAVVDCVA